MHLILFYLFIACNDFVHWDVPSESKEAKCLFRLAKPPE